MQSLIFTLHICPFKLTDTIMSKRSPKFKHTLYKTITYLNRQFRKKFVTVLTCFDSLCCLLRSIIRHLLTCPFYHVVGLTDLSESLHTIRFFLQPEKSPPAGC
uniref:Uncharacterized protein n=1 Tax=Acanthochromis polyacanthus TaxID=80966 RepID=A0A3Q1FPB0_9TELE